MSNIINQIIEIDSVAQQRLAAANEISLTMKEQIEAKTQEIKMKIMKKCEDRIQKINVVEKQCAEEKMAEIKAENDKIIQKLEQTYAESHKQIEKDIFNNIIAI
ncbi:hypothetical protein RBG61_11540 [Paludicola sp. MB14-C6]|uniref:hypothetical protein n=1 Tax=Paludihabitans sp. MB14-C6 TaxID=3070656 RepID=UPI0027DCC3B3|nr:hypothetical protein [Paludicola sp. MB14-C6]WMJ22614.1 hypothetical protein RBG61_11540 [Paludicola sp. MB14-C6]